MNSHDRSNLNFIMSLNEQEFDSWLNFMSNEDIDYALELIRRAKAENQLEEMELAEVMYMHDDDMTEANKVIDKIKNMKP